MYNRRYEKVFLMLRQETAGYALGKRPPWGSCVMEIKNGQGRLHLTVQGLRRGDYGVYVMLGEDPAETLFCGELKPGGKDGKGEMSWDFSPDALGHGKKAEDLRTVILLADEGKGSGFSAPLTAFFGEKKDWKREFRPERPQGTQEIHLQAAEAAVSLPVRPRMEAAKKPENTAEKQEIENKTDSLSHKIAEEQKAESCHGNFSGLLAKFRQELNELEETGILTPEETEHIRNMGKPAGEEMETPEQEFPQFADNRELQPFGDGVSWKCLALEELVLLPQVPLKWQKEYFFLLSYRKYRHCILRAEEGGFWLGLPCADKKEDAEAAKAFGFQEFRPVNGGLGYWLMRLEEKDGAANS